MLDGVDWEIKHNSSHIGYGSDWSTPKRIVALLKMILIQTHVATRPPGFFSACKLPQPSHFLLLHLIQFFALRFHIFEALFCRHLKSHILSRQLLVSAGIGDTILQFVDTITASQKVCRHHHGISESCRHHQGISESCRHHHGIHRSISRHHHGIYKSF